MRKLRLLFASMFALLAWNGAFAQTDGEYNAAQAALENGKSYLISTVYDGTTYYLTDTGYLTDVKDEAGVLTFEAVAGEHEAMGWKLAPLYFTNPDLSGSDVALNPGHIRNNTQSSARNTWEAQVFYRNEDGKYAVRATNAAGGDSSWALTARTFWTVNEGPLAEYSFDPAYIWEINEFVDERLPLFNTVSSWLPRLAQTGIVEYTSNAKDPSEGSYEALTDGDYGSFFHSTWHASNDPQADHYLQAELPSAIDKFMFYFKKRSQNDNNRPTEIQISASVDGEEFTDITSITEGLPTDAAKIDYMSEVIDMGAAYKYIRFTIPTTNNGAKTGDHVFFTFSEFYILQDDELTQTIFDYADAVKAYTDIDLDKADEIAAIEKLLDKKEFAAGYYKAMAAIEDGASYRIFANVNGTKYFLTAAGTLTDNELKANTYIFNKVAGVQYEYGFILDNGSSNCFSNPYNTNEESLKLGSINNNGSKRSDWDAQVFFLNSEGKYAVRCTNAAGATSGWGWVGSAYWTIEEVDGKDVAQYAWDPNFIWEIEPFTDTRKDAFEIVKTWPGMFVSEYTSNAKDPVEGSYEALTDGNYTTFFHSTWHSDNDPQADHYLQAELPNAAQKFQFYFKKRSQNENNRPTEILISASNDGENFTDITSITEGLPTDAAILDYTSEMIDLGAAYKYIRFTVPTTNNMAKTGDHVFFTFSEFYILPATALVAEAMPFIFTEDYTDLTFEQVDEIAALNEKLIEALTRVVETDLTAQVGTNPGTDWVGASGWCGTQFAPAITTKDGRTVQMAENYQTNVEATGDIMTQTITGLANGTYRVTIYGNAFFTEGRGFESDVEEGAEDVCYLFAGTGDNRVQQFIPAHIATSTTENSMSTLEGVEVTDGTLVIGLGKAKPGTNWHTVQVYEVTAVAKFADVAAAAEADYEATNGKVMEQSAADAMANAKAAFDANDTDENLTAFQNAVAAAKASAEAYANAAEKLQAMEELVAKTNFYTEDAYNEYYGNWQVKYDERTLTTEEANALQNPNVVTDWHAALTVDNFLLSVWDAEPDFASNYYINSWSVEGDNDGTGFRVPFFEYWTGDGDSLGERELTAQLEGLAPGNYAVNVWARVRVKNGEDMDAAHGITLSANDGEPVDVTTGEIVGQFRLAQFTANGVVGEDGVLTVKFNVAADNDISWLSFKNVKYVATADINSLTGSFAQVDNAKLAKSWVSTDSTFVLSCPLNFMTAASLGGGAWNSVRENLADPYIGFYSNESYSDGQAGDGNFTVTAPDGVQITALVINASILKGAPTLSAEGIDEVTLTKEEQSITIPFDKVQSATFHVGGDAAWMKATIQVQFEGAIASQGTPSVTGIASVNTVNAEGTIFNMAGQRVNKALKGIYIINGKKVVK